MIEKVSGLRHYIRLGMLNNPCMYTYSRTLFYVFIHNEEAHCASHASCAQVLQLPSTLCCDIYIYIYVYIIYLFDIYLYNLSI